MTCDEVQEALSQFIDDEPDHEALPGVFAHIETCGDCRAFLRSALRIRTALVTAPVPGVPEDLDARVRRLWERREAVPAGRARLADIWRKRFAVPIPAAAAVVLIVVSLMVSTIFMVNRANQAQQTVARERYAITLPTVEIQGSYADSQKPPH